ncbi:MAG: hypothetical protein ACRDRT_09495, partial [Pseudonocardiaceae bacterium]
MGEPMLVLGQQLADFEEDKERLDILAIDKDGEIVLIELKVTDDFRVTDLQALAYAGAYADRETDDFANTLRRHLERLEVQKPAAPTQNANSATAAPGNRAAVAGIGVGGLPAPNEAAAAQAPIVSLESAKTRIVEFLEIDDFESWHPSQQVRIKLVAPTFPRRVLNNVKHLGDVYG